MTLGNIVGFLFRRLHSVRPGNWNGVCSATVDFHKGNMWWKVQLQNMHVREGKKGTKREGSDWKGPTGRVPNHNNLVSLSIKGRVAVTLSRDAPSGVGCVC
jgi:hypothetical protein